MSVLSTRGPQKIPISQIIHEWVEVVPDFRPPMRKLKLFAESLSQKGSVNLHHAALVLTAVVLDEAKHSELIHKKVDARACSADHCRQGFLRYSGKAVKPALIPLPCDDQPDLLVQEK